MPIPIELIRTLREKGLLKGRVTATPLAGGNLNHVYLLESPAQKMVVKQALPRAKFNAVIQLSPSRALTEGKALLAWKKITQSNSIPKLFHLNQEHFSLAMEAVPSDYSLLTYDLLEGKVNLNLVRNMALLFAKLHSATYQNPNLRQEFSSQEMFQALKMDLFHWELYRAASDQTLRSNIRRLVEKTSRNKVCLIHGDFQPKNIMVKENKFYLLDHEIATFGDPAHDLGNLMAHYLLSAIINYPLRAKYFEAIEVFFQEYEKQYQHKDIFPKIMANALQHFAPVMYGRVDGTAKVSFLDERTKAVLRRIVTKLATNELLTLEGVFKIVENEGKPLQHNHIISREKIKGAIF